MIRIFKAGDPGLKGLMERHPAGREQAAARVTDIINSVRADGDRALCRFAAEFDRVELVPGDLVVRPEEIEAAYDCVDDDFLRSLRLARQNIETYHRKQVVNSWFETGEDGVVLGQMVTPLARVGIYVPGGKASYPSSVLMNAVPARVAGVSEIVMVTPPGRDGKINPYTLVAAAEAGVSEIYRVGGAQAVAALAYGTQTIRPVDKITGPGNLYVTLAKQQVYGRVDIDMLAGPSEVLVVAGAGADPVYIAADLLSQAEHDEMAAGILITPDEKLALAVRDEVRRQLAALPRREVAARSVENYGAVIITGSMEEAFDLANQYAPEHLELLVTDPFSWLGRVRAAGAVFLGPYSPEPVGDYLAGPNHVLPTGGTAKFYSPLGVDAFIKRTSIISYTRAALERVAGDIIKLAGVEGLDAHANAVRVRVSGAGVNGAGDPGNGKDDNRECKF